jgi:transcription elongation GreA/GreB family factor
MARQGVLERVGWRFWRCWASSFTIDPDGCMADLYGTLALNGIQPTTADSRPERYTEQRVAKAVSADRVTDDEVPRTTPAQRESGIKIGDSVVIRFLDDQKTTSFVLSCDRHDPVNGLVGAETPLGKQLLGFNEEDEIEVNTDGRNRRVLIVRAERGRVSLH